MTGRDITVYGGHHYAHPPDPVLVHPQHAASLRRSATKWADELAPLMDPPWAVRLLTDAYFKRVDSDKGLLCLRQHFGDVNDDYADWRTRNLNMRGLSTTLYLEVGGRGDRPTSKGGEVILEAHNAALVKLVGQLTRIPGLSGISGQCDRCRRRPTDAEAGTPK